MHWGSPDLRSEQALLDLAGGLLRNVKTIWFVAQHRIADEQCCRVGGADAADERFGERNMGCGG